MITEFSVIRYSVISKFLYFLSNVNEVKEAPFKDNKICLKLVKVSLFSVT